MSKAPKNLKYTKDHEWIKIDGKTAIIGITDHAQKSLGDITFVELPSEGASFNAGDTFGVVESVKAASDLYMPVSGEILEINSTLESNPETVNDDPYEAAWMIKIKLNNSSDIDGLLSAEEYAKLI